MNSIELRQQRAVIASKVHEIIDRSKAENRDLNAEESATVDAMLADIDKLKTRVDQLEKMEEIDTELTTPIERGSRSMGGGREDRQRGRAQIRADFQHWMLSGEVRGEFRSDQGRAREFRDTIVSTDSKGGYLIAPTAISADIVKAINEEVFIRSLATITQVTDAKKLGIRKRSTRMADADWTTEVQAVTEDTTGAYDRRDLEPYLLSKLAKVSERTLALSTDAETEITDELGYKFGVTEEKAFLTGNGSSKPMGLFYASASGVSTGRDVAAASSTVVAGDDFINVKYGMKQGYLADPKAGWIMHRDVVKAVRKLKASGSGDYIWQPGLQVGQPDRLLDMPIYMSEFAPNTFSTGQYVAILGNYRHYRIAEVAATFIQRLVERYADTNEIGFIGRRWVDGAPVLEEAFSRLKLA